MQSSAPHRKRTTATGDSGLCRCRDPQLAEAPPAAEGTASEQRALSSPSSLCQAHARSPPLRNLCFRNHHRHHHPPSRIPSCHQNHPFSIKPGSVSQTPAGNRSARAPASKQRGRDIGSIRRRWEHVQKERQEEEEEEEKRGRDRR